MSTRRWSTLLAVALLLTVMAVPARSSSAEVTSGQVVTLPGGLDLGYELSGSATMVRTPVSGGTTRVVIHVWGLDPNTTYPTHVHNAPCSATPPGGGHYQNEVGGAVDVVNEIWPTVITNARGVGVGRATHDAWAREDAQAIVIHYPPDTSIRLACVDLS